MRNAVSRLIGATGAAVVAIFVIGVSGACQKTEVPAADTAQTMAPAPPAAENAQYSVTFTRLWTEKTHPFEYPGGSVVTGPHLSGLIGATHADGFEIFQIDTTPTPGLEKLSEEGKHSPLDQEINDAISAGRAGALFETGPIRDASKTETVNFTASSQFPMVSAVAMVAPSPDWFAGVADVNLMEGGRWVATKTVDMFAYDSGGDDGSTYKARDKDTKPKKPTTMVNTPQFVISGNNVPVARLTFTKI